MNDNNIDYNSDYDISNDNYNNSDNNDNSKKKKKNIKGRLIIFNFLLPKGPAIIITLGWKVSYVD